MYVRKWQCIQIAQRATSDERNGFRHGFQLVIWNQVMTRISNFNMHQHGFVLNVNTDSSNLPSVVGASAAVVPAASASSARELAISKRADKGYTAVQVHMQTSHVHRWRSSFSTSNPVALYSATQKLQPFPSTRPRQFNIEHMQTSNCCTVSLSGCGFSVIFFCAGVRQFHFCKSLLYSSVFCLFRSFDSAWSVDMTP
jgi:hypothetical protein